MMGELMSRERKTMTKKIESALAFQQVTPRIQKSPGKGSLEVPLVRRGVATFFTLASLLTISQTLAQEAVAEEDASKAPGNTPQDQVEPGESAEPEETENDDAEPDEDAAENAAQPEKAETEEAPSTEAEANEAQPEEASAENDDASPKSAEAAQEAQSESGKNDSTPEETPAKNDDATPESAEAEPEPAFVQRPYLRRYAPEANSWEFGLFGGVMFPSGQHQLFDPSLPVSVAQPYRTAGELGARFGYYPLSFLGVEVEGAAMPSQLEDGSPAGLWTIRGHVVGQLPGYSITPFVLIGAGALGGSSDAMGFDHDDAIHFGAGAKVAIDEYSAVRLDIRDVVSRRRGGSQGQGAHHPEILLGITFTPTRRKPDADSDGVLDKYDECPTVAGDHRGCPGPDTDGDEVLDESDECQEVAGVAPSGCPDSDGDGILDRDDHCTQLSGPRPTGCPEKQCADPDTDSDGIVNEADACPEEPGPHGNHGCPVKDTDGDGIVDSADACPQQAGEAGGDKSGCPRSKVTNASEEAPAEEKPAAQEPKESGSQASPEETDAAQNGTSEKTDN